MRTTLRKTKNWFAGLTWLLAASVLVACDRDPLAPEDPVPDVQVQIDAKSGADRGNSNLELLLPER
jgi:hypothetical protein